MPIDANTVRVGNCYRTADDQGRRVVKIDLNGVTYESWGLIAGNHKGHLNRATATMDVFAAAVDQPIACPLGIRELEDVIKEMGIKQ